MESISTYSDARSEYLKQLSTWVVPHMIQYYRSVWAFCAQQNESKAMVKFQELCAEVPKWNQDTIAENVNKLLDSCRCDYLEELMAAVFIAHTKVLVAIRVSSKHKKLQITLPKLDHFIHRVFSECARGFWKAPFLFFTNLPPIEMQKNLLQAESLCNEGLSAAVRSLLPIKNILNEYLSDEVSSPEPIIEDIPKNEESEKALSEKHLPEKDLPEKTVEQGEKPKQSGKKPALKTASPKETQDTEDLVNEEDDLTMLEPPLPASAPVEHSQAKIIAGPTSEKVLVTKLDSEQNQKGGEQQEPIVEKSSQNAKSEQVSNPDVLVVDTKPSVHFNNYDNVFDDSNNQTTAFKYVPKDIEPGDVPELKIEDDLGTPLSMDMGVTNLDPPGVSQNQELPVTADTILD